MNQSVKKLKYILIKILILLADFISFFVRYEFIVYRNKFHDLFYSRVVKKSLLKSGKNFHIKPKAYLYGMKYVEIGDDFYCFKGLRLEVFDKHLNSSFQPSVKIANNVSLNFDCHIACCNKILIGNNVLLASRVFITDHSHGNPNNFDFNVPPNKRELYSSGPVVLEDNVWIGEGVSIMPNVHIGKNSIIGANAVVTKSFPPNSVIGGVPAKLIREINDEK
jgi:acetyltransferase-like isoleucine patch superfamily enzyme